jgi:MATE family multidrug resistance protein
MLCHFTGYWIIGLPLGVWLCFNQGLGARGLWMGLSIGLILIGLVLVAFWRRAVTRLESKPSVGAAGPGSPASGT